MDESRLERWWPLVVIAVVLLSVAVIMVAISVTDAGAATRGKSRYWRVTYNSALSLHEAAVPAKWAKPGKWMRVCKGSKCVKVRAVSGGCTCFDISDEAFNRISDTSVGVIKAKVTLL